MIKNGNCFKNKLKKDIVTNLFFLQRVFAYEIFSRNLKLISTDNFDLHSVYGWKIGLFLIF